MSWRKVTCCVLRILQENGGELAKSDVVKLVDSEFESGRLSDVPREFKYGERALSWPDRLGRAMTNYVTAKFMGRRGGIWRLLPEVQEWLAKPDHEIWAEVHRRCQPIQNEDDERDKRNDDKENDEELEEGSSVRSLDDYESDAREGFLNHIRGMDPFAFQQLVASLLRAMGYLVPFVSQRGHADGGIDIIAYRDHLGATSPRLKVQVKHHQNSVGRPDVENLYPHIHANEIGVFVSSSGFSRGSKDYARTTDKHLELIDINRFIDLWREFYPKMADEDKRRMPIRFIGFLDTGEDD